MKEKEIKKIINQIASITNSKSKGLHEPFFCGEEINYLNKAIKSKSVSSYGLETNKFENKLKKITKSKHVISVINGTSALHLSLFVLGVNRSSEVLIPALNYIASTHAVLYLGATPHFIDVEEKTLGVDFKKLDSYLSKISIVRNNKCINKISNKTIKAIVVTHVFGHPCNLDEAKKISKKYKIELVEDAAEGLGSFYKKKHLGTFGKLGILSFNGNKIITTGGGGAILTNNNNLSKKLNHISRNSRSKKIWEYAHNELGFNYRLPSLNSQLGLAQLKNLNFFLKRKRNLFFKYKKIFNKQKEFKILEEPINAKSNYWLNALIFKTPNKKLIYKMLKYANEKKIQIRPVWKILSKNLYLKKFPRMKLECANKLEHRILNIPSSSDL